MSTGYTAAATITVSDMGLKKILGKKVNKEIFDMLSKVDGDRLIDRNEYDLLAPENYDGVIEDGPETMAGSHKFMSTLSQKVNAALDTIYKVTGIHAYINYHSPDEGDRYDEVSGFYFSLREDECYVPTAKYKKLRDYGLAERAYFVQFG